MTEEEWLRCEDPRPRADYLFDRANARKLRLWACACGREVIPLYENPLIGEVLNRFESVAEGNQSREEQQRPLSQLQWAAEEEQAAGFYRAVAGIAHSQWIEMVKGYEGHFALGLLHLTAAQADSACPTAEWEGPTDPPTDPNWRSIYSAARGRQSALARDIFGNPFRPVAVDPAWLAWNDGAIRRMAQAIYDNGAFNRLPLLADALEDAGCTDADILGHCRGGGEHVRGCWVVDLLLGKS
ncbi:MAG TPA: hypothetical protein VMS17_15620 [Gemmataceae bacterium]|nr:hypothetical protein [Gemmataceae bacterium]